MYEYKKEVLPKHSKEIDFLNELGLEGWVYVRTYIGLSENSILLRRKKRFCTGSYVVIDIFDHEWPNIVCDEDGRPKIFSSRAEAGLEADDCQDAVAVAI